MEQFRIAGRHGQFIPDDDGARLGIEENALIPVLRWIPAIDGDGQLVHQGLAIGHAAHREQRAVGLGLQCQRDLEGVLAVGERVVSGLELGRGAGFVGVNLSTDETDVSGGESGGGVLGELEAGIFVGEQAQLVTDGGTFGQLLESGERVG